MLQKPRGGSRPQGVSHRLLHLFIQGARLASRDGEVEGRVSSFDAKPPSTKS